MFEGRWLKTIVRTRPKRAARRPAASAENPARTFAPNSRPPRTAGSVLETLLEPEGDETLDHEAAGEGIEREQSRQPQHDPLGSMKAQPCADRVVGEPVGGHFHAS